MDELPQEETRKEQAGLNSFLAKLYRPGPLIALFSLAFIGMLSLVVVLLNGEQPLPPPQTAQDQHEQVKIYEEETRDLEELVKQADLALIETMRTLDLTLGDLVLQTVEVRELEGRNYHYQALKLPVVPDLDAFLNLLKGFMSKRLDDAAVITVVNPDELTIAINTTPTHHLILQRPAPEPVAEPQPKTNGPVLAIVIDDIGENMPVLKGLVSLEFPVTMAVWPNASQTRASVELITEKQREILIHFPMEPRGYPQYNPGDDALFISMNQDQITQRVAENVLLIPEAVGVNNHMGSGFTAHEPGMLAALTAFKQHGLFFLDSLTSGKSVARPVAKQVSIPFYERDVFIDNVKEVPAIVHQLKKAEAVALSKGFAIAIGHPYPETLAALKQWYPGKQSTVTVVPLSHLRAE